MPGSGIETTGPYLANRRSYQPFSGDQISGAAGGGNQRAQRSNRARARRWAPDRRRRGKSVGGHVRSSDVQLISRPYDNRLHHDVDRGMGGWKKRHSDERPGGRQLREIGEIGCSTTFLRHGDTTSKRHCDVIPVRTGEAGGGTGRRGDEFVGRVCRPPPGPLGRRGFVRRLPSRREESARRPWAQNFCCTRIFIADDFYSRRRRPAITPEHSAGNGAC